MNTPHTSDYHRKDALQDDLPLCILYVCTSCRSAGTPREPRENRQGFILYQRLQEALKASDLQCRVELKPAGCLSICPRPCGIALSAAGAWTYLFGDQQPDQSVHDILQCVTLYLESSSGFMTRAKRPQSLQGSILGRVPPRKEEKTCT